MHTKEKPYKVTRSTALKLQIHFRQCFPCNPTGVDLRRGAPLFLQQGCMHPRIFAETEHLFFLKSVCAPLKFPGSIPSHNHPSSIFMIIRKMPKIHTMSKTDLCWSKLEQGLNSKVLQSNAPLNHSP